MLKVIGIVIIGLSLIVIIKSLRPEYSYLVRLAAVSIVFLSAIVAFDSVSSYIQSLSDFNNVDALYVKTALKITAVCIVCKIVSDICKDCGESALASQTELFGRATVLIISFPIIKNLFDFATGILK